MYFETLLLYIYIYTPLGVDIFFIRWTLCHYVMSCFFLENVSCYESISSNINIANLKFWLVFIWHFIYFILMTFVLILKWCLIDSIELNLAILSDIDILCLLVEMFWLFTFSELLICLNLYLPRIAFYLFPLFWLFLFFLPSFGTITYIFLMVRFHFISNDFWLHLFYF